MAGLISQATIEQIRAASDIVEVIGGYFPLKHAGANFTALCPFHKEKTPSFNVHPGKQIFHCFGCHKGGDVFRFVQDYENIAFLDSVKRLAERAGIILEFEQSPEYQRKRALKDTLRQLHEQLAVRWHTVLLNEAGGETARAYLHQRGVSDKAVSQFRLGYAPDNWEDTLRWGRSKKYDPPLLEQAGVAIRKEGTDRHYGRFRGRLMFPISDEQGRVIGFSGRVLDAEAKGAKYVNSPETPLFHKGGVIYGLHLARRAVLDAGSVLVCEGQLDLIACHMAGIANVVAPQGTALTADHARMLKRYAGEVIMCFDADTAGQNAMARSLDVLLEAGLAIRVLALPPGEDPDDCLRSQGPDRFRERLDAAEGFFDFHLRCLCEQHNSRSDHGQRAVLQAMGIALRKAGDAVLLDRYTQHTALALGVSTEAVRAEFRKIKAPRELATSESTPEVQSATPPQSHEAWLLRLVFHENARAERVVDELDLDWVEHVGVREILRRWRDAPEPISAAVLLNELPAAAAALLTSAMAESRDIPEPGRQLADLITRLRNQHLDRELARLNRQLAQQDLDEDAQRQLLAGQQALRERKQQPLALPADAA